jgi:hypothetical protein
MMFSSSCKTLSACRTFLKVRFAKNEVYLIKSKFSCFPFPFSFACAMLSVNQILGHGKDRASARIQRLAQVLAGVDWRNFHRACMVEIAKHPMTFEEEDILEVARYMLLKAEAGDWFADEAQIMSPKNDHVRKLYQLFLQFPETYAFTCLRLVEAYGDASVQERVAIIDYNPYEIHETGHASRVASTISRYNVVFGKIVEETPELVVGSTEKTAAASCSIKRKRQKEEDEEKLQIRRSRRSQPKEYAHNITVMVHNGAKKRSITIPSWALVQDLRIRVMQAFKFKSLDDVVLILCPGTAWLTDYDKTLKKVGIDDGSIVSLN